MLGDRLGESSGKITNVRVLPTEGQQVWLDVSFQGRGILLGQEVNETGTYRQTVRPGGVLYGEGHVLMMSPAGDIVDWVGGGVGRPTGRGYKASYGDGSYHWTTWEWTGGGLSSANSSPGS